MLVGTNVKQRIELTLDCDNENEDPKTIFVVRPLTAHEMYEASSKLSKDTSLNSVLSIIDTAVVEVNNFEGNIEDLPLYAINELIDKIMKINRLTEEEEKN